MKRMLLLTAVLMLLASCTQEATLSVGSDVSSFQFDADGGEFDAVIFTNGSWTASCEDEGVTVTPSSGDCSSPVHIKVGSNEEHYTKVIRITLNATLDNLSRTGRIVVTQQCRPFIFCEEPFKETGPEGGIVRFQVNSNDSWQAVHVEGTSACLLDPAAGGPNLTEFSMRIPENTEGAVRTFAVRLVLDSAPATELVLTVRQNA